MTEWLGQEQPVERGEETPVRNVELLEKTMLFILDHPEKHAQLEWIGECGTKACFAGWACLLSGVETEPGFTSLVKAGYRIVTVRQKAAELLGLTLDEADVLFHGGNELEDLRVMVKDLVNGDTLRDAGEYWNG